jgi:TorA maturation chaperone TorD
MTAGAMSADSGAETFPGAGASALSDEDRARADLYAVLARLFFSAPDRSLLDAIGGSEGLFGGQDTALGNAWDGLAAAARNADPDALTTEFDSVFVGVGKAEVTPYCSFYATPAGRERIVVALRDELRDLGLARTGATHEPEDHIAALCEVMRKLVSRGSDDQAIGRQKQFFLRYISPAYMQLTDAILGAETRGFYQAAARVMRAFFDVEAQSFEMV